MEPFDLSSHFSCSFVFPNQLTMNKQSHTTHVKETFYILSFALLMDLDVLTAQSIQGKLVNKFELLKTMVYCHGRRRPKGEKPVDVASPSPLRNKRPKVSVFFLCFCGRLREFQSSLRTLTYLAGFLCLVSVNCTTEPANENYYINLTSHDDYPNPYPK